jgi:hypothetical protein
LRLGFRSYRRWIWTLDELTELLTNVYRAISSPGKYGASLMRPCNDGERQWNFMSDLTCR